jgi:anaerobic ribonucleoside-triphosphate reductase activating protein
VDTWSRNWGWTVVDEVIEALAPWLADADGITISGGEPFDQSDALAELLSRLRSCSKADILVFTGYPFETIESHLPVKDQLIDALITDPFDFAVPQTRALRGSDNQRLWFLTLLGRARFGNYERAAAKDDRSLDAMFDANGDAWLAGIPARGDLGRLQQLLSAAGTRVSISEDRRHKRLSSSVLSG